MPHVTRTTTVADLLAARPGAAPAFVARGMACVGCPMARFETLADAAAAYSVDLAALLADVVRLCRGSAPASRRARRRTARPDARFRVTISRG